MKLKVLGLGIAMGVTWGLMLFGLTVFDVLRGAGHHVEMLGMLLCGYKVTWLGSIIGFGWGFLMAFVAGVVIALIYNVVAGGK